MGPKMVRFGSKKGPLFDAFFDRFYNKIDVVFQWLLSLFLLLSVSFLVLFFSFLAFLSFYFSFLFLRIRIPILTTSSL